MHILNLNTKKITKTADNINLKDDYHFIICNPWELKFLKTPLNIDIKTYKDCLTFDEKAKVNIFDDHIFFSFNIFQIIGEKMLMEEINIFLSEKYIIVLLRKQNEIYNQIKELMGENFYYKSNLTLSLLVIFSTILRIIISNQFENLERIEDDILELEDKIINKLDEDIPLKINYIRSICRDCVKNTRPLTYIMDTLLKEGMEFFSEDKSNAPYIEKEYMKLLQGVDSSLDKLYNFSLSTRELSDKLLDIHSSKVSEKTNNLITKLTILTGTAVPITIITGIYGMNFRYMPELDYIYGYQITLLIIILIPIISFIIFKYKKML
ncbi:CorA family divalent cation transporter [Terrisporobacter sp.]